MSEQRKEREIVEDVGLRPLVRPAHVPEIGGCPSDCGHSDEEHAAFDIGLYDGEHGTTIPPAECCEDTDHSRTLRDAWMVGYHAGAANLEARDLKIIADVRAGLFPDAEPLFEPKHRHIQLDSGAMASVDGDVTPATLDALNQMALYAREAIEKGLIESEA